MTSAICSRHPRLEPAPSLQRVRLTSGWAALLLLWMSGCGTAFPPPADSTGPTVILGARLIAGDGSGPVEDAVIIIDGSRIRAVGPRSHTAVPKGGEIIDGRGKTVIPGLVDLAADYRGGAAQAERKLTAHLGLGITTVRGFLTADDDTAALVERLRSRTVAGPRLYPASEAWPAGAVATVEAITARLDTLAAARIDFAGLWSQPPASQSSRVKIEEVAVSIVKNRGLQIITEALSMDALQRWINLGIRDVVGLPEATADTARFTALCKQHNVVVTPLVANRTGWTGDARVVDAAHIALVGSLAAEGVQLGAGSGPAAATSTGLHDELIALVAAGLSPLEALTSATGTASRLLEGEGAEFGTLRAGNIADLVLIEGNPLDDIRRVNSVERVMRLGKWVAAQTD